VTRVARPGHLIYLHFKPKTMICKTVASISIQAATCIGKGTRTHTTKLST